MLQTKTDHLLRRQVIMCHLFRGCLRDVVVLTVQTTEVTTCAGNRQTGGAGMEMIKWLLLDGINSQGTRLCIDLADEHPIMVPPTATSSRLTICNMTVMRTELAFHRSILSSLIIPTLVCLHPNYALEYDGFIHIQFRIAPAVPTQSCLILRAMSHKFLLGPVHLISHLG